MNLESWLMSWLRKAPVILGLLCFAALVWFGGPLLAFGESASARPGLAAAHHHRRRGAAGRAPSISSAIGAGAGPRRRSRRRSRTSGEESDDSDVLASRMTEALETLKRSSGKQSFLYELPWYIIIGPPGAGKTTALVNSGLKFPLAGQDGAASIAGVGGTRYCDFWFTEDAVLIDTAGRYTTHDSDAETDRKSWLSFLSLLKDNRAKQPINGVILAISVEDVLLLPEDELTAHANAIRKRLLELHQELKIDFPVYALFTKADLIDGFREYFGNFTETAAAQGLGRDVPDPGPHEEHGRRGARRISTR